MNLLYQLSATAVNAGRKANYKPGMNTCFIWWTWHQITRTIFNMWKGKRTFTCMTEPHHHHRKLFSPFCSHNYCHRGKKHSNINFHSLPATLSLFFFDCRCPIYRLYFITCGSVWCPLKYCIRSLFQFNLLALPPTSSSTGHMHWRSMRQVHITATKMRRTSGRLAERDDEPFLSTTSTNQYNSWLCLCSTFRLHGW